MNRINSDYTVEVDAINREEWDELIRGFNDANIFQTWEYGVENWGEKKMSHLILKRNGKIVAATQLWIFVIPILNVGFAHVSWGPMWRIREELLSEETVQNMLSALEREYVRRRGLLLRIRSFEVRGTIEGEMVIKNLEQMGYRFRKGEAPYHTYRLDLERNLNEIRGNFRKRWKRKLNRADRQNLEVLSGTDGRMIQSFKVLYKDLLTRKKFREYVANIDAYSNEQRTLPENLKMRIFLCKFREETVAGVVISLIGNTAMYLLAASSTNCINLKLNAAYLLQWRIIEWLKEHKIQYYDLRGGIDGDMSGVKFFKSGLSGEEIYYLGSFERCEKRTSLLSVRVGELIQEVIKKRRMFSRVFWRKEAN